MELDEDDIEMLENNKYRKNSSYYEYGPSILLILDDINGTQAISDKKFNPLSQLISNHRHSHLHLSVFILMQNYTKIPVGVRTLAKQYFLFRFGSKKQIYTFYEEIANTYFENFKQFSKLYKMVVTSGKNNFLLIDMDPKNEELSIRKNFNEIIKIHENSDSDNY